MLLTDELTATHSKHHPLYWSHTRHISDQGPRAQTSVDRDPKMPTPEYTKTTQILQYVKHHTGHASIRSDIKI